MENILDILVEYSKKGQLMDYDALKKIVKYAIIEKNLKNYISNMVFHENLSDSYKKNCRGTYNMNNHEIIFCEHGINEIYNQVKKSSSGRLSEYDEFIVANALVIQHLLHEIEHANQIKKMDFDNDFESMLLKASNSYVLFDKLAESEDEKILYQYLKEKQYINIPCERLAENYSMREIVEILNPIFDEVHPQIEKFMKTRLYKRLIRGYDDYNLEPTESYLIDYDCLVSSEKNKFLSVKFYDTLALEKESDLENRLFFGLGITESEYDMCKVNKKKK